MRVRLTGHTPLATVDRAIGMCWNKQKEEIDIERIERVANKNKHSSTIEHLVYNFEIEGVSRALLQELARHRIASPSVKSTRYTLKELRDCESFEKPYTTMIDYKKAFDIEEARVNAEKYLVFTGDDDVDRYSIYALENLRKVIVKGVANDKAKYCLPDSLKTSLAWTINARSLQNFLALRTSKAALWEIRDLAKEIFNQLPGHHQFLFKGNINDD